MRFIIILPIFLVFSSLLLSQKLGLQVSYEPAGYLAQDHVNDYILFLNRNEFKIGMFFKSHHLIGVSYENAYAYTDNPSIDVATYSKRRGFGVYYRFISRELRKIDNVRLYGAIGLFYRNSNETLPIIITEDFRFGHMRISGGFEYNFWKYFYLHLGVRPVYFFEDEIQLSPKFLFEMRLPIFD